MVNRCRPERDGKQAEGDAHSEAKDEEQDGKEEERNEL
jgi:hypothetical protein